MLLGLSTYSLSRAIKAKEMTLVEAVQWIADNGGEHVELSPGAIDLTADASLVDAIRRKAETARLPISNYSISANFIQPDEEAYEAEIQRVMRHVDVAARMGVKRMRHDVAHRGAAAATIIQFNADLPMLAEACRRIADYALGFGITTSVENHGYHVQGSERVQALVHAVGRSNYRTTLDIGNFICTDEDPVSATKKNLPIASMVHLKDFYLRPYWRNPGEGWSRSANGNYFRGAVVGQGDIEMAAVIQTIKQSGYDGYISIEFEGKEPWDYGCRVGLENARRLWSEA